MKRGHCLGLFWLVQMINQNLRIEWNMKIPFLPRPSKAGGYPASSTLKAESFLINDMVIGTAKANVIFFKSAGSQVEVRFNMFSYTNILLIFPPQMLIASRSKSRSKSRSRPVVGFRVTQDVMF